METESPYSGRPVTDWIDPIRLVDVDGEKVGDIVEVNPDFVVVKQGHLLGGDDLFYIPRTEIASEDEGEWSLRGRKDDLDTSGWNTPPTTSEWSNETYRSGANATAGDATVEAPRDRTKIRRYEEELQASKTQQQAGEVTINKNVVEEQRTIQVPVRREEVHIERHAASGDVPADDTAFKGDSIRVPVTEEQVEVRTVPRVVEEIEVSKVPTEETKSFEGTVRREEVNVDDSTVNTTDDSTPRARQDPTN